MKQLLMGQDLQPECLPTKADIYCVILAALCHDLGHPCFSHMSRKHLERSGWCSSFFSFVETKFFFYVLSS